MKKLLGASRNLLSGLIAALRRVLDNGAVELLAPALHEYLIACPPGAGARKFQLMQQRVVIAPLREGEKITGLVATIEDVTSRREKELEGADPLAESSPLPYSLGRGRNVTEGRPDCNTGSSIETVRLKS